MPPYDNIEETLGFIEANLSQCSQWEQGFFESVAAYYKKHTRVSEKQSATIQKIAHRFSPEAVSGRQKWIASYTPEKRETATICASYYRALGTYWQQIAANILLDAKFIPSEKQYRALCENKYASKVLEAYRKESDFPVGTLATVRPSTAPYELATACKRAGSLMVLVVSDSEQIVSAAKGGKRYRVVPIGASIPVLCEERHLKGAKKRKKKKETA